MRTRHFAPDVPLRGDFNGTVLHPLCRFRTSVPTGGSSAGGSASQFPADSDDAYRLTNTIEAPWWSNPGVQFFGSVEHGLKGARSTSVGDILECVNKDRYAVGRAGFVLLAKNS